MSEDLHLQGSRTGQMFGYGSLQRTSMIKMYDKPGLWFDIIDRNHHMSGPLWGPQIDENLQNLTIQSDVLHVHNPHLLLVYPSHQRLSF